MREQPNDGRQTVVPAGQLQSATQSVQFSDPEESQLAPSTASVSHVNRPTTLVDGNQTLTVNFQEFIQYLSTLSQDQQGKTLQLIQNVQTQRMPEIRTDYQAANHTAVDHNEPTVFHRQVVPFRVGFVQDSNPVTELSTKLETSGTKVCVEGQRKDCNTKDDESNQVREGEGNLKWKQLMVQAASVQQKSNTLPDGATHSTSTVSEIKSNEQQNGAERQSITFELLELIRKAAASENGQQQADIVPEKEHNAVELDLSKQTAYPTIDTAQIIEVNTSKKLPEPKDAVQNQAVTACRKGSGPATAMIGQSCGSAGNRIIISDSNNTQQHVLKPNKEGYPSKWQMAQLQTHHLIGHSVNSMPTEQVVSSHTESERTLKSEGVVYDIRPFSATGVVQASIEGVATPQSQLHTMLKRPHMEQVALVRNNASNDSHGSQLKNASVQSEAQNMQLQGASLQDSVIQYAQQQGKENNIVRPQAWPSQQAPTQIPCDVLNASQQQTQQVDLIDIFILYSKRTSTQGYTQSKTFAFTQNAIVVCPF